MQFQHYHEDVPGGLQKDEILEVVEGLKITYDFLYESQHVHHLYGKVKTKVEELWIDEFFGRPGEPDETLGSLLEWVVEGEVWTDLMEAGFTVGSWVSSAFWWMKSSCSRRSSLQENVTSSEKEESAEGTEETVTEKKVSEPQTKKQDAQGAHSEGNKRSDSGKKETGERDKNTQNQTDFDSTISTLLFDMQALDISDLDPPKSENADLRIIYISLYEASF